MDRDEYVAMLEQRVRDLEEAAASALQSAAHLGSPEESPVRDGTSSASPVPRASKSPRPAAQVEAEIVLDGSGSPPEEDEEALLVDLSANDLASNLCCLTLGPDFRAERKRRKGTLADDLQTVASKAEYTRKHEITPVERGLAFIQADPTVKLDFASREGPQNLEEIIAILPTQEQLEVCMPLGVYLAHGIGTLDPVQFPLDVAEFWRHDPTDDLHMLACILAFAASVLFRQSSSGIDLPGLGQMSDEETATLAKEWTLASIRTLVISNIFEAPTITGIRALAILGYIPLHLTALHTSMFSWSMANYLAGRLGLHQEPPGHDAAEVSPQELESRRRLLWVALLGLDFGAAGVFSKDWHLSDRACGRDTHC